MWDGADGSADVGAVTWIDGETGLQGELDGSASLTGTLPGDNVGRLTVALPSGNYVVASSPWDNGPIADAGAVTWRDGALAIADTVTPDNSFTGKSAHDNVGAQVVAFEVDDYLVVSPGWDNTVLGDTDVGAITYCVGATSCGAGDLASPTPANSLTGKSAGDMFYTGVAHLGGADFVLTNAGFDDGALHDTGAITWWRGATGAAIDRSNSLFGAFAEDRLGNGNGITPPPTAASRCVRSSSVRTTRAPSSTATPERRSWAASTPPTA